MGASSVVSGNGSGRYPEHTWLAGVRANAVADAKFVRVGAALAVEHNLVADYANLTGAELGATVSVGAPWTDDIFGLTLEGGARMQTRFAGDTNYNPYGRAGLIAQAPTGAALRPWAGFSLLAARSPGGPPSPREGTILTMIGIELGVAWSAW